MQFVEVRLVFVCFDVSHCIGAGFVGNAGCCLDALKCLSCLFPVCSDISRLSVAEVFLAMCPTRHEQGGRERGTAGTGGGRKGKGVGRERARGDDTTWGGD